MTLDPFTLSFVNSLTLYARLTLLSHTAPTKGRSFPTYKKGALSAPCFVRYCLYKILTLSFLFAVRVHIDELRTDFVEEISNYEPWPVLDLCIYLSHVLTDDSQTEKL